MRLGRASTAAAFLSVHAPTGARPVCVRPPLGVMNETGSLDRQCAILRRAISQVGPIAPSPKGLWRLCQSLGKCMCQSVWHFGKISLLYT